MRRKFIVEIDMPKGTTINHMLNYISDAISEYHVDSQAHNIYFDPNSTVIVESVPIKRKLRRIK